MPRDAFLTALCKACLPPKFAMSLITSHRGGKSGPQDQGSPEKGGNFESDSGGNRGGVDGGGAGGGNKKKSGDSVSGGAMAGGGEGGGGKPTTPVSGQKGIQSSMVSLHALCT